MTYNSSKVNSRATFRACFNRFAFFFPLGLSFQGSNATPQDKYFIVRTLFHSSGKAATVHMLRCGSHVVMVNDSTLPLRVDLTSPTSLSPPKSHHICTRHVFTHQLRGACGTLPTSCGNLHS